MEIADSAVEQQARPDAEEALAALVSQYAGTLYRVAFSVLRNASDAEDAVQEAFLRVLRHRHTLGEVRDQRVWLIRIVWNIVLDRKRRAKTRPETDDVSELARVLPAEGLTAEDRAAAAQHHAHVLGCVEKLPVKEREVLLLSAFEELNSQLRAAGQPVGAIRENAQIGDGDGLVHLKIVAHSDSRQAVVAQCAIRYLVGNILRPQGAGGEAKAGQ